MIDKLYKKVSDLEELNYQLRYQNSALDAQLNLLEVENNRLRAALKFMKTGLATPKLIKG